MGACLGINHRTNACLSTDIISKPQPRSTWPAINLPVHKPQAAYEPQPTQFLRRLTLTHQGIYSRQLMRLPTEHHNEQQ